VVLELDDDDDDEPGIGADGPAAFPVRIPPEFLSPNERGYRVIVCNTSFLIGNSFLSFELYAISRSEKGAPLFGIRCCCSGSGGGELGERNATYQRKTWAGRGSTNSVLTLLDSDEGAESTRDGRSFEGDEEFEPPLELEALLRGEAMA